jgi:hypothetical protein
MTGIVVVQDWNCKLEGRSIRGLAFGESEHQPAKGLVQCWLDEGSGVQAVSRNHLIFGQYLNLHFNTPFALSLTGPENS